MSTRCTPRSLKLRHYVRSGTARRPDVAARITAGNAVKARLDNLARTRGVIYTKRGEDWYPELYEHGPRWRERLHVARRFERFLEIYRRPDGSRWTGQKLDEATGGVVTRSYVTNLRKGRIDNPRYEKMLAIARAMGFPPEEWFEDAPGARTAPVEGRDLAARVAHRFETVAHPGTASLTRTAR